MKFTVYRTGAPGSFVVARTVYIEDARAVLSNWRRGYITDEQGEILETG